MIEGEVGEVDDYGDPFKGVHQELGVGFEGGALGKRKPQGLTCGCPQNVT